MNKHEGRLFSSAGQGMRAIARRFAGERVRRLASRGDLREATRTLEAPVRTGSRS